MELGVVSIDQIEAGDPVYIANTHLPRNCKKKENTSTRREEEEEKQKSRSR